MALLSYQLPDTSAHTFYTSTVTGSQTGNAITCMIICNTSSNTTATLTMWAVTSGGSASTTNMIINALSIPGGETVSLDQEKLVLGSGDFLVAQASVSTTLSITLSTLPT
jgi:hypothetical protein